MIELTNAAQRGYCPKRILLLSDTSVLPYSLADLPLSLAGFVSKHSSQSILAAAIALALAGGKCFPPPDAFTRDRGEPESGDRQAKTDIPRRRWYDKDLPPPEFSPLETVFVSRSEEHTSELQSLMRISYAVFCLKKKNKLKK